MLTAPMVAVFVALALGIALADALLLPLWACILALLGAATWVAFAWRSRRGVYLSALLGFVALGMVAAADAEIPAPVQLACDDRSELFRARVDAPSGRRIRGERTSRPTELTLLAQRCGDEWRHVGGRVGAELRGGETLARGDEIMVRLWIEPLAGRRNPTDVDPFFLARKNALSAFARVRSEHVTLRHGSGFLASLDRGRDAVARRFEALLPGDLATLAKALSYGDQSAVSLDMRERWSNSGLAHLLSVSGLHVSIFAGIIYFLMFHALAFLPGAAERFSLRRAAAVCAIAPVILFCLWAASPPAAVRSTIMTVSVLVGQLVRRPSASMNALGLAGAVILLASPATLYDPGFVLSFGAMVMLLALPEQPKAEGRWGRMLAQLKGLVTASFAATLITAPVTAYYFGRVSFLGIVTNLVGVPLGSALGTPLTLLHAAVAPLSETLSVWIGWLLHGVLWLLDGLAMVSAAFPFAALDVPMPRAVELVAFYVFILVFMLSWRRSVRLRAFYVCGGVLLVSFTARAYERFGTDTLTLTFPYVGQGDGALVTLPGGDVMLIDAGGSYDPDAPDPGRRVLAPLLRQRGIRSIDIAVVTHPHPDHLEGFRYLLQNFPIRELWWSGAGEDLPTMRALMEAVVARGGVVKAAKELPTSFERAGVRFDVLHPRPPEPDELAYPLFDANDNSVVFRMSYRGRSALFVGDIEHDAEALLAPSLLSTEIVKVPHHGSRTSSTQVFLDATKPAHALISCGARNQFNFPAPEVVARYEAMGTKVWRTDEAGLVEMSTSGDSWRVTTLR